MPDRTAASKWLEFAKNDYNAAVLLFEHDHSLDTVGIMLQQSLEKALKSILVYHKKKIVKTHLLLEIYSYIQDHLSFSDREQSLLENASDYYIESRSPDHFHVYPEKKEIEDILEFAGDLIVRTHKLLGI